MLFNSKTKRPDQQENQIGKLRDLKRKVERCCYALSAQIQFQYKKNNQLKIYEKNNKI
ncbi:unnamed protein product [Paramecium pentaurelia]|uniref:Uncharacterized protein n=1 Tax=Paramecium pentaurelia TaxID=43138 RepID=A0A8S1WPR0_9CILI|nr:unnamed protein product [Paramecium pentaurelia]